MPLNPGADHLGGEAVAFHGQFHPLDLDGAEVVFAFDEIGELWIASHGANSPRDEALLQINDKEMVHLVWRVKELHKIVIHEVSRVVALEALIPGCFRLIAGNVPFAGIFAGEFQVEIITVVHNEVKTPTFQLRAVGLRELIDGIIPARIVFEIQFAHLPFIKYSSDSSNTFVSPAISG